MSVLWELTEWEVPIRLRLRGTDLRGPVPELKCFRVATTIHPLDVLRGPRGYDAGSVVGSWLIVVWEVLLRAIGGREAQRNDLER